MSKIFNKETVVTGNEDNMAVVVYESGDDLYVCKAVIGTALTAARWQIRHVNTNSGVRLKWCDGNEKYDNTATDLATVQGHSFS